ncbi:unannotated protein [freshwater metagenome]|uniref:Unannotated protein n=1 Tax=freshwater metagenome TaxID=449393 RepID=A0A6J7VMC1_9ZZZZ
MPVLAVIDGGIEYVSTGSTSATCARRFPFAIPALRPASGSEITEPPDTSEPVPADVGSAIRGSVATG